MTKLQHVLLSGGLMVACLAVIPGCASDGWPEDVPRTAVLNTEGTGRLTYTAPSSGMVYVYDEAAERLVYSGNVLAGQRVVVDPKEDRIDLDDRKVSDQKLGGESRYQVYFDPRGARVVEHRVVERRAGDPVVTERRVVVPAPPPAVTEQRTTVEERVEQRIEPAPPPAGVTEQRTTVEERIEHRVD